MFDPNKYLLKKGDTYPDGSNLMLRWQTERGTPVVVVWTDEQFLPDPEAPLDLVLSDDRCLGIYLRRTAQVIGKGDFGLTNLIFNKLNDCRSEAVSELTWSIECILAIDEIFEEYSAVAT